MTGAYTTFSVQLNLTFFFCSYVCLPSFVSPDVADPSTTVGCELDKQTASTVPPEVTTVTHDTFETMLDGSKWLMLRDIRSHLYQPVSETGEDLFYDFLVYDPKLVKGAVMFERGYYTYPILGLLRRGGAALIHRVSQKFYFLFSLLRSP